MAAGRQLRLLLWKDYLIRKRNVITLAGIIWGLCVMSSLYIVRINIDNQDFPSCQFPARALPSAGILTFMQSYICSVDNTCSPLDQFNEIPSYEKSKLTEVKRQIWPLMNNATVVNVAEVIPDAIKLLSTLAQVADNPTFLDISKNGLHVKDLFKNPNRVRRYITEELHIEEDVANSIVEAEISLDGIMQGSIDRCDVNSIAKVIKVENKDHVEIFVSKICILSKKVLQKLVNDLFLEVNIGKYVKMAGDMYYRMSGDDRISRIGDMTTAVLRMMSMKNFLPTELSSVLNNEDVDFSYVNLTMITQALDLFQPTFGETDAYKTIRDVADVSVIGFQYLYKIWKRQSNNTVEEVTDLAVMNVRKFDVDKELDKLTNVFKEAIAMIEDLSSGNGVDNLFNVLSKASNFIYKFLSGRTRHNFLFYLTLMTKLVEGAEQAVIINMNIEQVVYNVSKRNPDGVKVLLSLPPDLVSKGLEALADPERVQLLTDKIDEPKKMFCEVNQIHSFFSIPRAEASKLIVHLCTDAWNNYITDMITSFGIFEMRDNINSIASLFILETIGRDTTEYLYPIDKDFKIFKNFTRTLAKIESHKVPNLNWSRVLGIDEDSEIMKKVREKTFLGNQVLITVNGALAKEVIKQNPLLEYKISPPFRDATTLLLAINEQLSSVPEDVTRRARELYPRVVEMILLTALNEDKTYRALSTPSEEIFCNGVENAASYLELPPVDVEALVSTLCDISAIINTGLQRESIFGNAIAEVKNTTHGPLDDIDWSLLIGALKDLYLKLDKVYPYIFQYKTYGMDDVMQKHVDEMVMTAKDFWFSKKNINRSMHVSMKFILRLLDVVDCGAFNITSEKWLMLKYGVSSAMGPLAATGDFIKLLGAISRRDDTVSEVPHTTAVALTQFLQNMPQLVVDATDVIVRGDTDVEPIIEVMNAEPPWPCSNLTLDTFSERSQEAMRGLETIFCMDRQLQEEWVNYFEEKNIASIQSEDWNTTTYQPHLFLKFSAVFTSAVEDLDALKDFLQSLFDDSEGVSFASSVEYAIEAFNVSDKDAILRNFFSKLDTVLTAINTSSVDQAVPLNTLWRNYFQCSSGQYIEEYCWRSGRAAWKLTLQFLSVALGNMAEDLLTYFRETNEPNTDVLKLFGFTSNTGLYALYDKFPEFVGALLNSYWDLGFMNQVRRASLSQFWDCDALLGALTPPPGSPVDDQLIHRVAPFICPSLLHWISLPRGDNILLDVIAKPQYFFFTIYASELNSTFENAYLKTTELANFVSELANKTITDLDDSEDNKESKRGKQSSLDKMRTKLERNVDKMLSFELTEDNPSYRLFNEANKKQFISSIYLTRITAIINKLSKALESLKVNETGVELSEDDLKKAATELTAIQKIFKRRPTEVVAVHFDVLTDVLWSNDVNYKLTDAMISMCDNMKNKNNTKDILSDTERVKLQICSKKFEQFYRAVEKVVEEDYEDARTSLLVLVDILQSGENREVIDIFNFFNER